MDRGAQSLPHFEDKPRLERMVRHAEARARALEGRVSALRDAWSSMARAAKAEVLVSLCREHPEWDGHHAERLAELLGLTRQHIESFLPAELKTRPRGVYS
jgi:hypothetical protein